MSNTLREVPSTILAKWAAADFSSVPTSDPGDNKPWLTPDGRLAVGAYQPVLTRAASPVASGTVLGSDGLGGAVAAPITWSGTQVYAASLANGTTGQTTIGNATGGVVSPGSIRVPAGSLAAPSVQIADANYGLYVGGGYLRIGLFGSSNPMSWTANQIDVSQSAIMRFADKNNAARVGSIAGTTAAGSGENGIGVYSADGITPGVVEAKKFTNGNTGQTTIGNATGGVSVPGTLSCGTYTVATLPSASANAGREAQVTDSSVTTNGSTVAGGGSNRTKLYSNGTNWKVVAA